MKNINSVLVSTRKKETNEKTRLDQAYERIDRILQNSNFYIENATDIKGDSIYMTIAGNINDKLPNLQGVGMLVKTKTKNNKVFLTLRIYKKIIDQDNRDVKPILKMFLVKDKKTEQTRIQKINHYIVKCNEQKKYNYVLFPKQQKEIDELREKIKALNQSIKDIQECRRIIKRL